MSPLTEYDPDLQYCPACGEEYRSDITICADCAHSLLSGKEMCQRMQQEVEQRSPRVIPITEDEPLVALQRGTILQLKQVQALLAQGYLASVIRGDNDGGCGKGCCGPEVTLFVREGEVQEVLAILEQNHRHTTGLDDYDTRYSEAMYNPQLADATCPACGYVFSTSETSCPDCGLCLG